MQVLCLFVPSNSRETDTTGRFAPLTTTRWCFHQSEHASQFLVYFLCYSSQWRSRRAIQTCQAYTVTFLSCTKTHEMHHTSIVCLQSFQSCLNCSVTSYCKHVVCVWDDAVTRWSFAPSQIHQTHRYRRERCCATLEDLQQSKPAHLIAPNVFSMYAALTVPR